jgi:hypothetical protein
VSDVPLLFIGGVDWCGGECIRVQSWKEGFGLSKELIECFWNGFDEGGPCFVEVVGVECFSGVVVKSDFDVNMISLPLDSLVGPEVGF